MKQLLSSPEIHILMMGLAPTTWLRDSDEQSSQYRMHI